MAKGDEYRRQVVALLSRDLLGELDEEAPARESCRFSMLRLKTVTILLSS